MGRHIDKIVYHCTASKGSQDLDVNDIRRIHLKRGWSDIGYHLLIKRNGEIQFGRPFDTIGAHVRGHNKTSIGVVYVGGVREDGRTPEDNRTEEQKESLRIVYKFFSLMYPEAEHLGHRDLSPDRNGDGKITRSEWLKACPCFDVKEFFECES